MVELSALAQTTARSTAKVAKTRGKKCTKPGLIKESGVPTKKKNPGSRRRIKRGVIAEEAGHPAFSEAKEYRRTFWSNLGPEKKGRNCTDPKPEGRAMEPTA